MRSARTRIKSELPLNVNNNITISISPNNNQTELNPTDSVKYLKQELRKAKQSIDTLKKENLELNDQYKQTALKSTLGCLTTKSSYRNNKSYDLRAVQQDGKEFNKDNCFSFFKDLNQNFENPQKKLVPMTTRAENNYVKSKETNNYSSAKPSNNFSIISPVNVQSSVKPSISTRNFLSPNIRNLNTENDGYFSGRNTDGQLSGRHVEGYVSSIPTEGYLSGRQTEGYLSGREIEGYISGRKTEGYVRAKPIERYLDTNPTDRYHTTRKTEGLTLNTPTGGFTSSRLTQGYISSKPSILNRMFKKNSNNEFCKLKTQNKELELNRVKFITNMYGKQDEIERLQRELLITKEFNTNIQTQFMKQPVCTENNHSTTNVDFTLRDNNTNIPSPPRKQNHIGMNVPIPPVPENVQSSDRNLKRLIPFTNLKIKPRNNNNDPKKGFAEDIVEKCQFGIQYDEENKELYNKINDVISEHNIRAVKERAQENEQSIMKMQKNIESLKKTSIDRPKSIGNRSQQGRIKSAKNSIKSDISGPQSLDKGYMNYQNDAIPNTLKILKQSLLNLDDNQIKPKKDKKKPKNDKSDQRSLDYNSRTKKKSNTYSLLKNDLNVFGEKRTSKRSILKSTDSSNNDIKIKPHHQKLDSILKTKQESRDSLLIVNQEVKRDSKDSILKWPIVKKQSKDSFQKNSNEFTQSNTFDNQNPRDNLNFFSMLSTQRSPNFLTDMPMKESLNLDTKGYNEKNTAKKSDLVYSTDMEVLSDTSEYVRENNELGTREGAELAQSFRLPYSSNLLYDQLILEDYKNPHKITTYATNNFSNIPDHQCELHKAYEERVDVLYYDLERNYFDSNTGTLTSHRFGIIYDNVHKIELDQKGLFVDLMARSFYKYKSDKSSCIVEKGVARFKDTKGNIVDYISGKIVDHNGIVLIKNLLEFFNLDEKKIDFGFYANTEDLQKEKNTDEGGTNYICDFDSRKLDLDDGIVYDSAGNQISSKIGSFIDKNGNQVDLLTGLIRNNDGIVIKKKSLFLLEDEYGNKINLKARKIVDNKGATIFKDIGIIKSNDGRYIDMMNGNICDNIGKVIKEDDIKFIQDPFGTKAIIDEAIIDSNNFVLTNDFDSTFRLMQQPIEGIGLDSINHKNEGKNMTIYSASAAKSKRISMRSIINHFGCVFDLRTGFIRDQNGEVVYMKKGKFGDDFGNILELKDNVLRDSEDNSLLYHVGLIEDAYGRVYDLKSATVKSASEYDLNKKPVLFQKIENKDQGSQSDDDLVFDDEEGHKFDVTGGTIKDINGRILERNLKVFADEEGNIFNIENLANPEEIIPTFSHKILFDAENRLLDLFTGKITGKRGQTVFKDLMAWLSLRFKSARGADNRHVIGKRDNMSSSQISVGFSDEEINDPMAKDWSEDPRKGNNYSSVVSGMLRNRRKEQADLLHGGSNMGFFSKFKRGDTMNEVTYSNNSKADMYYSKKAGDDESDPKELSRQKTLNSEVMKRSGTQLSKKIEYKNLKKQHVQVKSEFHPKNTIIGSDSSLSKVFQDRKSSQDEQRKNISSSSIASKEKSEKDFVKNWQTKKGSKFARMTTEQDEQKFSSLKNVPKRASQFLTAKQIRNM